MRKIFDSQVQVTQEFGVNSEYYKQFGLRAHEGLDIIPTGSSWNIYCLEDGVVIKDDDIAGSPLNDPYGIFVTIWHPTINKATQYCHLEKNYVQNGQAVKRGDLIGVMGKTGNVSGAHLHLNLFETDVNGVKINKDNGYLGGIDPLPFLQGGENVTCLITNDDEGKKLFEKLVRKSSEFDKTVKSHKGDGADPDTTSADDISRVDAGVQSRVTDLQNQLSAAIKEQQNREEQVSRLKQQLLDAQNASAAIQKKLSEIAGVYEGQLNGKQAQIDQMGAEKGELNQYIAELEAALKKEQEKATQSLTIGEVLILLFRKIKDIKLT